MRLSRIYTPQPLQAGEQLRLEGDAEHYLGKVLRAKVGQMVRLFNEQHGEYLAEIQAVDKRGIDLQLNPSPNCLPESLLPVHIGLGLSRGERMDYAIQKATELGVVSVSPLFTEHSEVKLSDERADKRTAHWQKVAISAAEQCGRCTVPTIHPPQALGEWLSGVPSGQGFILDPEGSHGFTGAAPDQVFLLIGPEGGISSEEMKLSKSQGLLPVRLGPRVLRTETAPVVALTALQLQWGDFRD